MVELHLCAAERPLWYSTTMRFSVRGSRRFALALALASFAFDDSARAEEGASRFGRLQAGARAGFGGPYYQRSDDPRATTLAVQVAMVGRLGVRAGTSLSFYVEPGLLAQAMVLAQTSIGLPSPPPDVPHAPTLLGVVSTTIGLRPLRYFELSLGPTLGGGPTVVGGGTGRLAVRIPTRGGIVLTPAFETFLVTGDRTAYGALFGTFGFEL